MKRTLAAVFVLLLAVRAFAQAPNNATLRVTVVDPSSAVVAGATITVVGVEDTTKGATIAPVQTTDDGIAVVPGCGRVATRSRRRSPGSIPERCLMFVCATATTNRSPCSRLHASRPH
jgi:hypothetical protein